MPGRLSGKVIIVTGATKGIGRGIALTLAGEGARVAVSGRNLDEGRFVVDEIERVHRAEAVFIPGDISRTDACRRLAEETEARFGRIDGLVNNAGIFPTSLLENTEEALFDEIFSVNIKGAFFLSKYVMRSMLARNEGGSIVNIGSSHTYGGLDELTAYVCSKGALLSLTKQIAYCYSDRRIRANWITVGWVVTEGELDLRRKENRLAWLERQADIYMPAKTFQTEADIASGCVYLLSDEATHVTGTELHINGDFRPARHCPINPPYEERILFYRPNPPQPQKGKS